MGKVEDKSEKTFHYLCEEIKDMINQMLETYHKSKVEPIMSNDSTGVAVVPCTVTDSVPIALEASKEIDVDAGDGDDLAREEDCVENTAVGIKLYPVLSFGEHLTFCLSPKVDFPILDLTVDEGMSSFVHKVDLEPWPNSWPCQGSVGMVAKPLPPWPPSATFVLLVDLLIKHQSLNAKRGIHMIACKGFLNVIQSGNAEWMVLDPNIAIDLGIHGSHSQLLNLKVVPFGHNFDPMIFLVFSALGQILHQPPYANMRRLLLSERLTGTSILLTQQIYKHLGI
uniref:Uncharacterized protein n=1 Tax=Oryza punctata TaxID=4537 RepID=A0A0E0JPU7_ORYPU